MKIRTLVGSAVSVLTLLVGVVACTTSNGATGTGEDRICTPKNNVFCRCVDGSKGTKVCGDDGKTFGECETGEGVCKGGEDITDPNNGKPVDDGGDPIEEDAGPKPAGNTIEACDGKPIAILSGQSGTFEGDTTGAADDVNGRAGACAVGNGGPDHVYALTATGKGKLQITIATKAPLTPLAYVRTTCADAESQTACAPPTGAGSTLTINTNILNGKPIYLVVDGASGSAGKYTVSWKHTPGGSCGDGEVDTDEACDDGNHTEDDGCSAGCNAVNGNPASGNTCPGHAVHVWPGKVVNGTGSTLPYGNTFGQTGSSCIAATNVAQDHVYAVTPHANGTLTVKVTPEAAFNTQLVARKTCADPTSQLATGCANDGSAGGAETMNIPVTNNVPVYVAVDGVLNGKGTYSVSFSIK